MTPDEVRMLDNRYALLFIRGERPVRDFKYDILKHPAVALTTDGTAAPYIHGSTDDAAFTIELSLNPYTVVSDDLSQPLETTYELLSEEDVEKEISVGTD